MEVRKADGGAYEPDSLTSFRNYIQRFLSQHNYKYSLIESPEFAKHMQGGVKSEKKRTEKQRQRQKTKCSLSLDKRRPGGTV